MAEVAIDGRAALEGLDRKVGGQSRGPGIGKPARVIGGGLGPADGGGPPCRRGEQVRKDQVGRSGGYVGYLGLIWPQRIGNPRGGVSMNLGRGARQSDRSI